MKLESVVALAVLLKKYNFELVEDFEFNPGKFLRVNERL